jgi:putative DNA primase/helicase
MPDSDSTDGHKPQSNGVAFDTRPIPLPAGSKMKLDELLRAQPIEPNNKSQQAADSVAPQGSPTGSVAELAIEVDRLAKLGGLEYDIEREKVAKRFGIRVSTLDRQIAEQRGKASRNNADPAHWYVEAHAGVVDGAALLNDIAATFSTYVVLPQCGADALALWVLHTWTLAAADASPILAVTSPEKRCGKTTVLIILQYLTKRSELVANISGAAIFRYVEQQQPTLLIDEADTFLSGSDEIRGILNSGHTRAGAHVIRTVEINGDHVPKRFSTWAPKAVACIGRLSDTLTDRSIVIRMQRRTWDQKVERLRRRDNSAFRRLRAMALRWAQDIMPELNDVDTNDRTHVPPELNDRAADNWRPLLAIADAGGGTWPARARVAARTLSGVEDINSKGVLLLSDIRDAFRRGDAEAITTNSLINELTADPEKPWRTYHKGDKPLSQRGLGALLAPFGIASETVHVYGQPDAKGYKRARFEDAWARYLPAEFSHSYTDTPGEKSFTDQDPVS